MTKTQFDPGLMRLGFIPEVMEGDQARPEVAIGLHQSRIHC